MTIISIFNIHVNSSYRSWYDGKSSRTISGSASLSHHGRYGSSFLPLQNPLDDSCSRMDLGFGFSRSYVNSYFDVTDDAYQHETFVESDDICIIVLTDGWSTGESSCRCLGYTWLTFDIAAIERFKNTLESRLPNKQPFWWLQCLSANRLGVLAVLAFQRDLESRVCFSICNLYRRIDDWCALRSRNRYPSNQRGRQRFTINGLVMA